MGLAKETFSTQLDYLIAGTAEIAAVVKEMAAALKCGTPVMLDSSDKLAAVMVSGGTENYRVKVIGLYGIFAEGVKSGEQDVVYLSGEFFADVLVLPANGSAADLEVPFRALGIFLK